MNSFCIKVICNCIYDPQDMELLRSDNFDELIRKLRAVYNKMPFHLNFRQIVRLILMNIAVHYVWVDVWHTDI